MENLEQFFKGKDLGYARDPRRMAYAKLQKNTQGMDREQLEAFIKANLMIPHSQYKMALGNLIQFLKKQDQMKQLNEVEQFKKLAGLLNENWHPDDPSATDMDDMEDEDPEDMDDVSENETDNNKEYYETTQDFLDVVFNILNDEMRVGYFSAKGLDKADAYLTKHGEKLAKSGKSAYDVADALMAKFNYTVSEDADYESGSGDTDAMGIDEWAGMSPEHANTFDLMDKLKDLKKTGKLNDANFKKAEDFIHKNAADLYYDYPDAEHALKHVFKTIKAGVAIGTEYTADSIVPAVQKLADELVAKGKYKPEQSKRVVAYAAKHKDELLKKLSSPIQWFNASAEKTQHGTK